MKKAHTPAKIQTLIHLYETERLTIPKIAARLGVSRQTIHERLVRSGVKMRTRLFNQRVIDRDELYRLYVVERLPVYEVAKILKTGYYIVNRELMRHSIELRPKAFTRRKPLQMDSLKIGQSAMMPCRPDRKPYSNLYNAASVRKIRISINRLAPDTVLVTRLG